MTFALKHAKPRALDAASRAHDAAKIVHAPMRTQAPAYTPRRALEDVPRCPFCSGGACDVVRDRVQLRDCVWCGAVSQRTSTGWLLVGTCTGFDGRV